MHENLRAAEQEVGELLDALEQLEETDFRELAAKWAEQPAESRERGWHHAKKIITRRGLGDLLDEAREEIAGWAAAAPSDFAGIEGLLGRPGMHVTGRQAAVPALLDAVVGLLAADELDADEREALSAPWRAVSLDGTDGGGH